MADMGPDALGSVNCFKVLDCLFRYCLHCALLPVSIPFVFSYVQPDLSIMANGMIGSTSPRWAVDQPPVSFDTITIKAGNMDVK